MLKLNNLFYFIIGALFSTIIHRIFLEPSFFPSLTLSSSSSSSSKRIKLCVLFGDSITQFGYSINSQTGYILIITLLLYYFILLYFGLLLLLF